MPLFLKASRSLCSIALRSERITFSTLASETRKYGPCTADTTVRRTTSTEQTSPQLSDYSCVLNSSSLAFHCFGQILPPTESRFNQDRFGSLPASNRRATEFAVELAGSPGLPIRSRIKESSLELPIFSKGHSIVIPRPTHVDDLSIGRKSIRLRFNQANITWIIP
jgi:hypothetical protein